MSCLCAEACRQVILEESRIDQRVAQRKHRVRELKAEMKVAKEQIAALKRIAAAAGIDLEDA